jgi:tripartite ATP-independent transporter DctM subunit
VIQLEPSTVALLMFVLLFALIFTGYPLAFCIGGIGMFAGFLVIGPSATIPLMYARVYGILQDYMLLAVPMFIFMGLMVQKSGVADNLFHTLQLWVGRVPGSLAIVTVMTGALIAATVGVFSASIIMLGLTGLPAMLKANYNKGLAYGSVIAGGCLGILIPPSIMLVIYGPMSSLSVGKLFMGAFGAGISLAIFYMIYILIRCAVTPNYAPTISLEEQQVPISTKLKLLVTSLLPPVFLILAVLGSIFFGIAAPTEAAGIGALASLVLVATYKKLSWSVLTDVLYTTFKLSGFIIILVAGASIFTGIFLRLGGGQVVAELILASPGGKWGAFALLMFIIFLLGMFLDWIGILLIIVPIVTPIGSALGFHPIWFAMMICINLQMAYMTPPFAPAIFILRGTLPADEAVGATMPIIRGVIPFIVLVMLFIALCIVFPDIVTWLPDNMIR